MPSWFPEGNQPLAGDNERRSCQKINSLLFDLLGDQGPTFLPEGSVPAPQDPPARSFKKINALLGG